MKNKDLVSIIIPLYNGAKYIKKCVESIQKSNHKNLEIIIVDDGSTDNGYEICTTLQKHDPRIKIFSKKNEGIAKTRTFGISKATGEYICFADQDDIVYKNSYDVLLNNIKRFDSDLCIGSFDFIKENRKIHFSVTNDEKNFSMDRESIENYILSICNACFKLDYFNDKKKYAWTIWNCIYKKSIIIENQICFKSFVSYEDDFLFNFDYLLKCNKISFESKSIYGWKQNFSSESHSKKFINDFYNKSIIYNKYIESRLLEIKNFNLNVWHSKFIQKNFVNTIINIANLNNNKNSNKVNISYLENLYNKHYFKKFKYLKKFNKQNVIITSEYFTYIFVKFGCIKMAYYLNHYIYNCFWYKILNFCRKIMYTLYKIGDNI